MTILLSCNTKQNNTYEKGELNISAIIDSIKTKENLSYIFVTAKLTNPSFDTLRYITMSCSWQDPFTTDMKDLVIRGEDCNKNVPKLQEVLPLKSNEYSLQLTSKQTIVELKNKGFRIGFNWVTAKDFDEMFLKLPQLREMKNVVWSDTLRIR